MEKYLLRVEFRYEDAPRTEDDYTSRSTEITIGVYDAYEDALTSGNEFLESMEKIFPLHKFPNGTYARKYRFSENDGPFGSRRNLVTNLAYLQTPFSFFAKIETLKYMPIDKTISSVVDSVEKYRKYKQQQQQSKD